PETREDIDKAIYANVALIASSPLLLLALKYMLASPTDGETPSQVAVRIARAAIAKAECAEVDVVRAAIEDSEGGTEDDHYDMLPRLVKGWSGVMTLLCDEEGVDGWRGEGPNGREDAGVGDWKDLPPWPASARAALAKQVKT